MKINRVVIEKVLLLVEENLRTAASTVGLKQRAENLESAKGLLMKELKISEQELEDIYSTHIRE